ncbi:MAG: hypothetical protein ACIALR_00720 [Blastopirellula sp. JB062]
MSSLSRIDRLSIAVLITATTCGLCGCGNSLGVAQVTGVVTYLGEPLPNADVRFIPDPIGPRGAIAKTNDEGRYVLMYDLDNAGALPGQYKVVISTRGGGTRPAPESNPGTASSSNPYAANRSSDLMVGGKEMLPMKYCSSRQTVLSADVQKGSNTIDFHLE